MSLYWCLGDITGGGDSVQRALVQVRVRSCRGGGQGTSTGEGSCRGGDQCTSGEGT